MFVFKLSKEDIEKNAKSYTTKLTGLLKEVEDIGIGSESEVQLYHHSMKTLAFANAMLLCHIVNVDNSTDTQVRNGDFLTLYNYLQPGEPRADLTMISGLQVILEDALKRIYSSVNVLGKDPRDPIFKHYPIIHLLSQLNPANVTVMVPFHGLRLPEDIITNLQVMLKETKGDKYYVNAMNEIYYLYNSFDRSSYLEFVKLYVSKIIKLYELK